MEVNCPKCDADISESYEPGDWSVGIVGGWYCDACDVGYGENELGHEPHETDVGIPPALPREDGRVRLMESKHTPGPWSSSPAGYNMRTKYSQSFAIGNVELSTLICGCFSDVHGGEDAAMANAQLIAAALDYHEAAAPICNYITGLSYGAPDGQFIYVTLGEIRALAKARAKAIGR